MKSFILAGLLVVAVSASLGSDELTNQFQAFKLKHGKTYNSQVEETIRLAIFKSNLQQIEEHNARYEQGLETYTKGVNKFADWTQEEFRSFLTLHPKPTKPLNGTKYVKRGIQVPSSVDWRSKGYVTEVKNQGNCGSCWAFSVTGSVEGAYYKKSGKLVSLSEQQLVDCSTDINGGCDGGYMEQTFPYIEEYGLQSEASYPYSAEDGYCQYDSSQVVTKIDNYVFFTGDEDALVEATASVGPISVAMDASYINFYSSGVFQDRECTTTDLNHGVLVVGYGSENGQDYWLVKNSWSADWGEEGYLKLLRGKNECGIAEDDSYPIIN